MNLLLLEALSLVIDSIVFDVLVMFKNLQLFKICKNLLYI